MIPANDLRNLRRCVGPAVWLFILLAAYTPTWTGDSAVYAAGGNVIGDPELADVLQVTPGIIARWRRRLKKAEMLDWLVRPGVGRVFIISALNKALPQEQAAIQRLAATSAQTALRSAEGSATGTRALWSN